MEAIVELELDDDEREALAASAAAVREVVGVLSTVARRRPKSFARATRRAPTRDAL